MIHNCVSLFVICSNEILQVRGHVRRRGGREAHYGNYLDLASGTFATNLICVFHNAREIREVLANFFHDLKDKLVAGGVSVRDPADDDDDYRIQSKLRDTLV